MKNFFALFTVLAGLGSLVVADVALYGQCGGSYYGGQTTCASGTVCTAINGTYSQCTSTSNPIVGYAALGGTTGGNGGPTVRVSTLAALKSAVAGNSAKTVILTKSLTGNEVVLVGSNTSLLGADDSITLNGIGIRILGVSNVIVRNLKIAKVLATAGDAIGVQAASKVWIDHVDLSSDQNHGKDYYDGLLDITHGCTYVTVSWSYLHDHFKGCLIGHDDSNGGEDKVATVTYHNNHFARVNSRTPSIRFGTLHAFNNYYESLDTGIDTRDAAQVLAENNVFSNTKEPLFSTADSPPGYAVARGNDFGGASNKALAGSLKSVPYSYSLSTTSSMKSSYSSAGSILSF